MIILRLSWPFFFFGPEDDENGGGLTVLLLRSSCFDDRKEISTPELGSIGGCNRRAEL